MSVPPMNATMYFKKPDKVHFDAKGFAILPREGLTLNPATAAGAISGGRGRARYAGREARAEVDDASAERPGAHDGACILYVDPDRWTPEKFTTAGIDGRTMSASFTHTRVDSFWLASNLFVEFSAATGHRRGPAVGAERSRGLRAQAVPRRDDRGEVLRLPREHRAGRRVFEEPLPGQDDDQPLPTSSVTSVRPLPAAFGPDPSTLHISRFSGLLLASPLVSHGPWFLDVPWPFSSPKWRWLDKFPDNSNIIFRHL